MSLASQILDALGAPAPGLKDRFHNLSWVEFYVLLISIGIFFARCLHYKFFDSANCGKMGFKLKKSKGFFTVKIGLFPSPLKLKLGLSVFIITFKMTFDFKNWQSWRYWRYWRNWQIWRIWQSWRNWRNWRNWWKTPKCKVKISVGFFKWTLAYKGKGW